MTRGGGGGGPTPVDALGERVTRLSVRRREEEERAAVAAAAAAVVAAGKGGCVVKKLNAVGVVEDSARVYDEDELFSANSMEGSLRGGDGYRGERGDASLPRVDSFEGELKFASVLPCADDDESRGKEEAVGRRPPAPGKTRVWLEDGSAVGEGGSGSASPMQIDDESSRRASQEILLKSPRRNGSMTFMPTDANYRALLVASPTAVKPRARRLDADGGSPSSRCESPAEKLGDGTAMMMTSAEAKTPPFSRTSSNLSNISLPSAFSPVSRPISRNTSKGDLEG